ncbi:UDP-3-O-(3-hydroxymyristoyl)glucosamine N-acyltransferase [Thermoproteota archaeon]
MKFGAIADYIEGRLFGDPEIEITGPAAITDAKAGQISFLLEKSYLKYVNQTRAGGLITFKRVDGIANQIVVKQPRKALALTISLFLKPTARPSYNSLGSLGVLTAVNSDIHDSVEIGCLTVIGHSKIGESVQIGSNVSIGNGCNIGRGCVIYSGVTMYDNVSIGENVILHSGCVIGADGFGYYNEGEKKIKIPHIGGVVIGNDVEIGANSCVDRGCLGNTIIGDGTKIDNLVQVAHNCRIGKNCIVVSQSGFMGKAVLEDNVTIAGQAAIASVCVGKNSMVAGRAGVSKDVPPNTKVAGLPAWELNKEFKKEAFIRKLVAEKYYKKGDTK